MAEVIYCREHERLPVVKTRSHGQQALTERQAGLLASLEQQLPAKAFVWQHHAIKFSSYCGVIQLGGLTLEVLPKIHGLESEPGSARMMLVRMLNKAGLFKCHRGQSASINLQRHTLLDIFIVQFCNLLADELLQGKPREYVEAEENLRVIKGRLLIPQQIKFNAAHGERLYCRFDELSEDILINRILRYTLVLLFPAARSPSVKKQLHTLLLAFEGVEHEVIHPSAFDRLVLNRTTERFKPLLEQCELFIKGLNPDAVSGSGKASSLLFDMNQLFETWVAAILKPLVYRKGIALREQGPRKYFAERADLARSVFQMKPDISLIDEAGQVIAIIDCKWKLLVAEDSKLGISQADLYQMNAYASRYQVKRLALLYPAQRSLNSSYKLELNNRDASSIACRTVAIDKANELPLLDMIDELLDVSAV